jgi:hypothetical protein
MSEKKVVGRNVAVALGIMCIILAVGLTGALTILTSANTKSSQDTQTDLQSWTEGNLYFNLTSGQDTNFTIPTAGYNSVTITIDAVSPGPTGQGFQVFIGFITANTTVDYQVYEATSYPQNPPLPATPFGYIFPPWSYYRGYSNWPASFRQTYEATFSKITVWIWNNSTLLTTATPVWGNVYYYLTT